MRKLTAIMLPAALMAVFLGVLMLTVPVSPVTWDSTKYMSKMNRF